MGRIALGLEGEGDVFEAVNTELRENLLPHDGPPSINFKFISKLATTSYTRNGSILIAGDRLIVDLMGLRYELASLSDPSSLSVVAKLNDNLLASVAPRLSRFRNWNYMYRHERVAKNFMYDLFDWTTQIIQLQHGQSYIHASSIQRENRGLAILGWGGVGKTTSLLKLVMEHDWKFLSDDLGIVDDAGTLYRAPKRLQVYGYNCAGQPAIYDRLMEGRSFEDKLAWKIRLARHGGKAVRRRVAARDLFGAAALSDEAQLTDLVYLEKASGGDYSVTDIPSNEVARRMSAIIMSEIAPFPQVVREAEAAGFHDIPKTDTIQQMTRETLERAFENKRCVLVHTGELPDPDRLTGCLNEILA